MKIGDHGMSGGVREDRQQQSSGGGLGVGLRGSAAPPPMASSTASEEDGRIPIWCAMRDEPPWMELTVKLSQLPYLLSGIYSASLFTWSNTPFAALTLRPTLHISRTASNRPRAATATTYHKSPTPPKSSGAESTSSAAVCSSSRSLSSRLRRTGTRPSQQAARPAAVAAKSARRAHMPPHSSANSASSRNSSA